MSRRLRRFSLALLCISVLATAGNIISNPSFELNNGSFAGWQIFVQPDSQGGWYIASGALSPVQGNVVPPPPDGSKAAMADNVLAGSYVMLQPFTISSPVSAVDVSFDLFRGNRAAAYVTPDSLDFKAGANQQARVDILSASAGPFDTAVIANLWRTNIGDPLVDSAYVRYSFDITGLVSNGGAYELRFAMVNNQRNFQFGVDNVEMLVSGAAAVPEPSTAGSIALASVLAIFLEWRRRRRNVNFLIQH